MSTQTLDLERLKPYLIERIPEIGDDLTAEKFAGGRSNPTFKLSSNGKH